MIARLTGTLAAKGIDRIEIMTAGGVGYELLIPLCVLLWKRRRLGFTLSLVALALAASMEDEEILRELAYSEAEIEALKKAGALG